MEFFLTINKGLDFQGFNQRESFPKEGLLTKNIIHLIGEENHTTLAVEESSGFLTLIIGDPVYQIEKEIANKFLTNNEIGHFIRVVDGFYFLLVFDKIKKELLVGNSLFGILPVYYSILDDELCVSSSFDLIIEQNRSISFSTDKQYYLEKALFNFPFLNRTPLEQVKTVPSNSFLRFNGELHIHKHTIISNYFVKKPLPWRKSLDHLSDVFLQTAKSFLPNKPFCATLTGGLDGRTVVSLALSEKKNFFTYSYGQEGTNDIEIPLNITKSLGTKYRPFLIDEKYAENSFWSYGNDFLERTFGLGNVSRSHYAYAAKNVLIDTQFLISGNFGSEIIRAMKVPGVMTSKFLFSIFESISKEEFKKSIQSNSGVSYLSSSLVSETIDKLTTEVWDYLNSLPNTITTNQKFYIYLYEQVFPKYFGPEIMYQRHFFNHRAPFLSFKFIEELLKTEVAGANSDFMETNPFKRYHGQVLYSHIIKKTTPELLNYKLDKNYKPKDFVTFFGPLKIALGFITKKIRVSKTTESPNYSKNNFNKNIDKIRNQRFSAEIVNIEKVNSFLDSNEHVDPMHFINIISAALYYNRLVK